VFYQNGIGDSSLPILLEPLGPSTRAESSDLTDLGDRPLPAQGAAPSRMVQ